MQQVSSCFREAGINMEVTNVYIHQKNRSMENSAIRSLHTRVVRNKGEGTYPLSEYYTDTPGKKCITCHGPLISPHPIIRLFWFF